MRPDSAALSKALLVYVDVLGETLHAAAFAARVPLPPQFADELQISLTNKISLLMAQRLLMGQTA
jgi:hypothetical protein